MSFGLFLLLDCILDVTNKQRPVDTDCKGILCEFVDYGAADRDIFDKMLKDVDEGVSVTSLVCLTFTYGRSDILGPQGHVNSMCLTGTISFKLMKVHSLKVKSSPDFGARMLAEVNQFFEDVNKNR